MPRVRGYTERTTDDGKRPYGNLGQDVIRQFRAMTLDFHRLQLRFRSTGGCGALRSSV